MRYPLLLLALVALSGCAKPPMGCAELERIAKESQAAVKVCSTIPGCQINYRDVIEVRGQIVEAQKCKARE